MIHKNRDIVFRRLLLKSFVVIAICFSIIITVFLTAIYFCKQYIWYPDEIWYKRLKWIDYHKVEIVVIFMFIGAVLITVYNCWRFAEGSEAIVGAIEGIYSGNTKEVVLPDEYREVQEKLKLLQYEYELRMKAVHEANQRKNDMIMYMAHDLKTPLTSVIGYLELLHCEKDLPMEAKDKYAEIAYAKSVRLEELMNEFFDITRYNFTQIILHKENVNLSIMLEQILVEFYPQFYEKKLEVTVDIEKDILYTCDVDKMERVFDNLFKNIINYSYAGTDVLIELFRVSEEDKLKEESESEITYVEDVSYTPKRNKLDRANKKADSKENNKKTNSIKENNNKNSDNNVVKNSINRNSGIRLVTKNFGKTIPKEMQEHIFEQFFRMDSSRSTNVGGSGIGLAVSKEIVELHGGKIRCESENEEIVFIVDL